MDKKKWILKLALLQYKCKNYWDTSFSACCIIVAPNASLLALA